MKTHYLDYNATTPVDQNLPVADWLQAWGNPSSIHWAGREPKSLMRTARLNIARMLGVEPLELVFTSGGSEANNLALKSVCAGQRRQVIISAVEHPSVRQTATFLERQGFRVDVIGVNRQGQLNLEDLQAKLSADTALVSIMYANNETGHIFPVREVAEMAHVVGALVHCDAVQALGKVELNLRSLEVDFATLSGHKFYALKGCGVLYIRRGVEIESLIHGGGQERGRRAGTENILAIASLGHMATRAGDISSKAVFMGEMRDHLEARILSEISDVEITGAEGLRLSNTSSLVIAGVDGETLLMNLDVRGFAVSTGAACSSGNPEPSPTLLAMGLMRAEAQSSLRLSLGWSTTCAEIDLFVDALKEVVLRLRSFRHGEAFAYGV